MKVFNRWAAIIVVVAISVAVIGSVGASAMSQQRNIVQTATAAGQFRTLLALAKRAGLVATLEGKGPFTLFAPTDAAFAKVPATTLTALKHDRAKLRAVLLYHVLKGRITAAKLEKLHSVKTLNGQSLSVRIRNGVVRIGGATVVKANVTATNGLIHVINKVLIPR